MRHLQRGGVSIAVAYRSVLQRRQRLHRGHGFVDSGNAENASNASNYTGEDAVARHRSLGEERCSTNEGVNDEGGRTAATPMKAVSSTRLRGMDQQPCVGGIGGPGGTGALDGDSVVA